MVPVVVPLVVPLVVPEVVEPEVVPLVVPEVVEPEVVPVVVPVVLPLVEPEVLDPDVEPLVEPEPEGVLPVVEQEVSEAAAPNKRAKTPVARVLVVSFIERCIKLEMEDFLVVNESLVRTEKV